MRSLGKAVENVDAELYLLEHHGQTPLCLSRLQIADGDQHAGARRPRPAMAINSLLIEAASFIALLRGRFAVSRISLASYHFDRAQASTRPASSRAATSAGARAGFPAV